MTSIQPGVLPSGSPAAARTRRRRGNGYPDWVRAEKIAFYGDSITDNSSAVSTDNIYSYAWSWPQWAQSILRGRFTLATRADGTIDFGTSNKTAADLADDEQAYLPEVAASGADTIFVMAGANQNGNDAAGLAAEVDALWGVLQGLGFQVIGSEITPNFDSEPADAIVTGCNALLPALARARQIPFFTLPTLEAGDFSDGVHLHADGGMKVGYALASFLDRFVSETAYPIPAAASTRWATKNPTGLGASVPTDWTIAPAANVTCTKTRITDATGDWWELDFASAEPNAYAASTVKIANATAQPLAGDMAFAVAEYEVMGPTEFKNFSLWHELKTGKGFLTEFGVANMDGVDNHLIPHRGLAITPSKTVPSGTTASEITVVLWGLGKIRLRNVGGLSNAITLTGTAYPGEELTCTAAGQFTVGGANVGDADATKYTVGVEDVGLVIRCGASNALTCWHPKDVSGVEVVLLANKQAYNTGTTEATDTQTVTTWVSQTATAHEIAQATETNRPTRQVDEVPTGAGVNDVVSFDGDDNRMVFPSATGPGIFRAKAYAYVFFAGKSVIDATPEAYHEIYRAYSFAGSNRLNFGGRYDSQQKWWLQTRGPESPDALKLATATNDNGYHVVTAEALYGAGSIDLRIDGVTQSGAGTVALDSTNPTPDQQSGIVPSFGYSSPSSNQHSKMDVAGFVIASGASAMSNADRRLIEKYLGMLIGVNIS